MEPPTKEEAHAIADTTEPLFYCDICKESFEEEGQLRAHCSSRQHHDVLASDDGRDWKFRPPPCGILVPMGCTSYETAGGCHQGKQCCSAHGAEELAEWKERLQYRKTRLRRALEQGLIGGYLQYAEELLQHFREAPDPTTVITEELQGLLIKCAQPLAVSIPSKEARHHWVFKLKTKTPLQRLVLLEDTFRHNFCLKQVKAQWIEYNFEGDDRQEWVSTLQHSAKNEKVITYTIKVAFQASMYATFKQSLAFDFGGRPVLVRHLSVDVVSKDVSQQLEKRKRAVVTCSRHWTKADVPLCTEEEPGQFLLDQYPAPDPKTFKLTQGVILEKLTKNNYVARMHELLHIEELARADIVGRHNIRTTLDVRDRIEMNARGATQTLYAQGGELYGLLGLEEDITDDTTAGQLLLSGCKRVWFALASSQKDSKVYEALLEHVSKKVINIRLERQCVQALGLMPRNKVDVEIQFHLNRLPLCELHYAIDKLSPTSLVFPDFSVEPDLPTENETSQFVDQRLNVHQRRAIDCIAAPRNKPNIPPVLIVGPFGTGKTFTLANALLRLLQQDNDARVLICTHSNSAADLYVLDYLDKYVADHQHAWPLRVVYEYRRPDTIDPRLLRYCLKANTNVHEGPWFRQPTIQDMEDKRVVITTLSSSRMLLNSGVTKGFFTHVLIDEAAQAMEAECILPIALADDRTRLVFAGDYMQINPSVYSVVARECGLHVSLLERLNQLYPRSHSCKVLLQENYRSHNILVQYTSESFYDGRLRAGGHRTCHPHFPPLTFFAARGCDIIEDTSYFNEAEVREVCEQIHKVVEGWPKEWGTLDLSKIAVLTPYYAQIVRIRTELRSMHLSKVKVESINNVQGKEFRVVMLTTVRTRATCQQPVDGVHEALNLGFLSDSKLLNTALTRAQSLVAVVGDPITLCSIGACRKLWDKFIKTCKQLQSLYNMTWEDIGYQLSGIELKKEYGLNPRAQSFVPPNFESSVDRSLAESAMHTVQNAMLQETAINLAEWQASPWYWYWYWQQALYQSSQQAAHRATPPATNPGAHHMPHKVQQPLHYSHLAPQHTPASADRAMYSGAGNIPQRSRETIDQPLQSAYSIDDYKGYPVQCSSFRSNSNRHQLQAPHYSRNEKVGNTAHSESNVGATADFPPLDHSKKLPSATPLWPSNPGGGDYMSRIMSSRNSTVPRRGVPTQKNPINSHLHKTASAPLRHPVHRQPHNTPTSSVRTVPRSITPTVAYISNVHRPVEWHAQEVTTHSSGTNTAHHEVPLWKESDKSQQIVNQIRQQMRITAQSSGQPPSYADVTRVRSERT